MVNAPQKTDARPAGREWSPSKDFLDPLRYAAMYGLRDRRPLLARWQLVLVVSMAGLVVLSTIMLCAHFHIECLI